MRGRWIFRCSFCSSNKSNKWGWRPHAADPWDQLAQTVSSEPNKKTVSKRPGAGAQAVFNQCRCTQSPYQRAFVWHSSALKSLQHHGSEGRIGPTAGSPECQTLLSERVETSCKPCLYLPFCTASFQIACCVLQVAFVCHSSGPRTVPQH